MFTKNGNRKFETDVNVLQHYHLSARYLSIGNSVTIDLDTGCVQLSVGVDEASKEFWEAVAANIVSPNNAQSTPIETKSGAQDGGASEFKKYRVVRIAEMRPATKADGENLRISISAVDRKAGSPKQGDMIARNPNNHDDCWLVAAQYFSENFEKI